MSSCNREKTSADVFSLSDALPILPNDTIHALLVNAIDSGDKAAYQRLGTYYKLIDCREDFFFYSLIMANKYNNGYACENVFNALAIFKGTYRYGSISKQQLSNLDSNTLKIALFYLLKGYELGNESAKYDLQEIYGNIKPIPKSSDIIRDLK